MKTTRCLLCRTEFTEQELHGATACPTCGTTGVPSAIAEDVQISINWHELRVLVIWAENWETQLHRNGQASPGNKPGVIAAIAKEMMRFRPEGAAPLRLFDEIRELQNEYPDAEMLDGAGNVLVPKVTKQ